MEETLFYMGYQELSCSEWDGLRKEDVKTSPAYIHTFKNFENGAELSVIECQHKQKLLKTVNFGPIPVVQNISVMDKYYNVFWNWKRNENGILRPAELRDISFEKAMDMFDYFGVEAPNLVFGTELALRYKQ